MSGERVSMARLWSLMLIVLVDMIGLLIVVPVLPFFATRLGAGAFLVGSMISAYAVAQLATAPLWGRMSDALGRRPLLLIGVSLAGAAHLMFAFASSNWAMGRFENSGLIAMLLVSRVLQGAGGAQTALVQAYVGDAIVPEERAKALGWISASTSIGVVLGPVLGSLAAVAGPAAPGLAAAALCFANLFLIRRNLPESTTHESRFDALSNRRGAIRRAFVDVLAHPFRPVARLAWTYALGMMAFMAMNAMLALFLKERFGVTEKTIWLPYAAIGAVGFVMRSVVLDAAVQRFGERSAMRLGLSALTFSFVLQPLAATPFQYGAALLLAPVGTALLFPPTSSLVTRFAERRELGTVMGVQQTFGGVARLVGPLWAGLAFQELGIGWPYYLCAAVSAFTFVFVLGLEAPATRRVPAAAAEAEPSVPASG